MPVRTGPVKGGASGASVTASHQLLLCRGLTEQLALILPKAAAPYPHSVVAYVMQ